MMNTHYKFFLLLLLLFPISIIDCSSQEISSFSITHGPYLQNVTENGATIVFTTNKLIVPGILLASEDNGFELIQNSHDGLINVGDKIHKVRIEDLAAGKRYRYKVFACEILNYMPYKCVYGDTLITESFEFTTFNREKGGVSFSVFCDSHDTPAKLSKYLDSNAIEDQDCYFLNGDIMGHIEDEAQIYSSFIDTCVNRFASEIPFFYVRGNHETRGQFARELSGYLDLPDNRYYYAFNQGPVRFIVLDGGEDKPDSSIEYSGLADFDKYRLEELAWLKKEVANNDFLQARFRIVIIHMPILENLKNWYGMAFLAEHFGPVLREAGIDLMISGHTHRNAWIEPQNSGFGYPIMICSNNNFIEAEVNENQISILLKEPDGEISDQHVIERK